MAKSEHISGRMINGEYWSNEALEEKPVEQLYPQLEDEPAEEYERRIGEIAAIMADDDSTPLTDKDGEAVSISDDATKKRISKTIGAAPFRHILDPKLAHKDEDVSLHGLEAQNIREEKAEKYRKVVSNMTTAPVDFIGVEGFDERRIAKDQRYVEAKELELASRKTFMSDDEREIEKQAEDREKTIEALLFPMIINYGLFDDSDGRRGRVMYPSRYDDFRHGVDVALSMPVFYESKDGKTIRDTEMISLDCTTTESLKGVLRKLNHTSNDGNTELSYAKDEAGDPTSVGKIPNFTIGIGRTTIDKLLSGNNIEQGAEPLRKQLFFQILLQANLRMKYLARHRTTPRPDDQPLRKENFNSEGDYDTYCTMLRISRSMKYALRDQEKTLLTKQTQLIQEAVSIKTTEYKDAEPGTI